MIKYYIQRLKEEISPQGFKTILTMWILFAIGIAGCEFAYADNIIDITQVGDGAKINFEQSGQNNEIRHWNTLYHTSGGDLQGDGLELIVRQKNTENSNLNLVVLDINGQWNDVAVGQGYAGTVLYDWAPNWGTDDDEGGNHIARHHIDGSLNNIYSGQRNGNRNWYSGHTVNTYINGNNNKIWTMQTHDNSKTINATLTGDGHQAIIYQQGNGYHNASINLTEGTDPYNLFLNQRSWSKSYSLTGTCNTSGGCNVSVTQQ